MIALDRQERSREMMWYWLFDMAGMDTQSHDLDHLMVQNHSGPYTIALPSIPQALLTTLSSLNSISTTPSLVTALTVMPLKSMGILLFSSSVQSSKILMP